MNFVAQMKKATKQVATQCTVLLRRLRGVRFGGFRSDHLAEILGMEIAWRSAAMAMPGHTALITVNAAACNITLELTDAVQPRAAYFEALDWPMLHRTFPEAEDLVSSTCRACACHCGNRV